MKERHDVCCACMCRYDVEAMRMVRRFKGHKDRVTGVVISQDARWLLSSSMDGTVCVWDIPAASCLQVCPTYHHHTAHSTSKLAYSHPQEVSLFRSHVS